MFETEQEFYAKGYNVIAGTDEAGRGPLAGPVVAAAVALKNGQFIEGVTDSKKLSEKKREILFDKIIKEALSYSIKFIDENVIDEINIRNASFRAMIGAVNDLSVKPEIVIVDGNSMVGMDTPHICVVKGDLKCNCVGAASILAKVARDRYMLEMHKIYPMYGFDKHKGYPTKLHYEKIREYGILPIHRRTFLKKIIGDSNV